MTQRITIHEDYPWRLGCPSGCGPARRIIGAGWLGEPPTLWAGVCRWDSALSQWVPQQCTCEMLGSAHLTLEEAAEPRDTTLHTVGLLTRSQRYLPRWELVWWAPCPWEAA